MTEPTRARSALNLRAVLAGFGLALCAVLAVVALLVDQPLLGLLLVAGALVAVIDLAVIARRRRQEPGEHTGLFE